MMTRGSLIRIAIVAAIAIVIALNFEHGNGVAQEVSGAAERTPGKEPKSQPSAAAVQPTKGAEAMAGDPFAPRGWQAAPPPPAAPVIAPPPVIAPAAAPVVEAPVAPSLPYAFMGQFDDGGRQVVYLSRNEQTFVVKPGETLEGMYKVLTMGPSQIEFEHLPTGTKQVLTIPAPNN